MKTETCVNLLHLGTKSDSPRKISTAKAIKTRVGSKLREIRITQSKKTIGDQSSDDSSLLPVHASFAKLYVFPNFDRSDALIYLPTTLSRHLNTGDIKQMSKLLTSHLDKSCEITMSFFDTEPLDVRSLVRVYQFMSDTNPDMISCATNIIVNGNKITATMHAKYTDVPMLYDHMRCTTTGPVVASILKDNRIDSLRRGLQQDPLHLDKIDHYLALAATGKELLVYVNMSLEMVVDDTTKKVSRFLVSGRMTSMHEAAVDL